MMRLLRLASKLSNGINDAASDLFDRPGVLKVGSSCTELAGEEDLIFGHILEQLPGSSLLMTTTVKLRCVNMVEAGVESHLACCHEQLGVFGLARSIAVGGLYKVC